MAIRAQFRRAFLHLPYPSTSAALNTLTGAGASVAVAWLLVRHFGVPGCYDDLAAVVLTAGLALPWVAIAVLTDSLAADEAVNFGRPTHVALAWMVIGLLGPVLSLAAPAAWIVRAAGRRRDP